ncbi:MAG: TolC family protein [Gemmatimonadales bacterium]
MSARLWSACALVLFRALLPGPLLAQAHPITLSDALALAREKSLELRAAETDLAAARADRRAAGTPLYNPEVGFSIGPSRNSDTTLTSYMVGVSQTLELGGKRGLRSNAANRRIEAAEARRSRALVVVAATVRRAFGLALIAQRRLATATEGDSVATLLRDAANERLTLGAGTQLEVNVAAAAAAQARRARLTAQRDERAALLELGGLIGLDPSELPQPNGDLPPIAPPTTGEAELVATALASRGDVRAAERERVAAETELRLARRLWWPDPTLGVSAGKAEDFKVVEFGVTLPIPLWNRGQGATAQATAALAQAQIVEERTRRAATREVREAYQGLASAIEAERGFDRDVIERLRENLSLAEESFRAGKIGLLVFNNVRRDLVEARLSYLDAVAEVLERSAALELAVGTSVGTTDGGGNDR